mmetsp:Transcript_118844/g.341224  ORF Transcript_118844/g.341224 Transcript_118844/m.341224 type:complete len:236 (+) Transcript_118844:267-974(+)
MPGRRRPALPSAVQNLLRQTLGPSAMGALAVQRLIADLKGRIRSAPKSQTLGPSSASGIGVICRSETPMRTRPCYLSVLSNRGPGRLMRCTRGSHRPAAISPELTCPRCKLCSRSASPRRHESAIADSLSGQPLLRLLALVGFSSTCEALDLTGRVPPERPGRRRFAPPTERPRGCTKHSPSSHGAWCYRRLPGPRHEMRRFSDPRRSGHCSGNPRRSHFGGAARPGAPASASSP